MNRLPARKQLSPEAAEKKTRWLYWWLLLTMLDTAAALYTVAMEEEDLALVPYAVVYRLFFITMIDVAKLFAAVEELAQVQMTWGKLARAGRI